MRKVENYFFAFASLNFSYEVFCSTFSKSGKSRLHSKRAKVINYWLR